MSTLNQQNQPPIDESINREVNQQTLAQAIDQAKKTRKPVMVGLYGDVGLEDLMNSYGGLDISQVNIRKVMPPQVASQMQMHKYVPVTSSQISSTTGLTGQTAQPLGAQRSSIESKDQTTLPPPSQFPPAGSLSGQAASQLSSTDQSTLQTSSQIPPAGQTSWSSTSQTQRLTPADTTLPNASQFPPLGSQSQRVSDQTILPSATSAQEASTLPQTSQVSPSMPAKQITTGDVQEFIRQVPLCSDDRTGKLGLSLIAIDTGIFVSLVWRDSPAAIAGLRFGDQVLQINNEVVAGLSTEKAMAFLQKAAESRNVTLTVRDRPFERAINLTKDENNMVGFAIDNGEVTTVVPNSSAERNGLLTNHQLIEVNGVCVVGMGDSAVKKMILDAPAVVITTMPKFVFDHLAKYIAVSEIRSRLDQNTPDV